MNISDIKKLSFTNGKVWAVGNTPTGELVVSKIEKGAFGNILMAKITGTKSELVPLESFIKFQVPIKFYTKPKEMRA